MKRGALDGALAEQPEPVLDVVQPRGVGWDEVQVDARLLGDLGARLHVIVRGVVVAHKVQVESLGDLPVDQSQERQPLLVAVPLGMAREHLARGHA